MEAHGQSIVSLLSGERRFIIPYYQRSYVWGVPQWERFLEDMEDVSISGRPYFLGSVILKQVRTPSSETVGNQRLVIDGQQRLTTLAVFFKVLSLVKGRPETFAQMFLNQLDAEGERVECKISHNRIDRPFFDLVIGLDRADSLLTYDAGEYRDADGGKVSDPNRVLLLYHFLLSRLRNNPDRFSHRLPSLVQMVSIDLSPDDDEQRIFDTVNSLGVELTTTELLKNYLFSEGNSEEFERWWVPAFESDGRARAYWNTEVVSGVKRPRLIDLFFHAFFMVKIHDCEPAVTSEERQRFLRSDGLFLSYREYVRTHLGGDPAALIPEIHSAALAFRRFFDPAVRYRGISGDDVSDRVNEMIFSLDKAVLIPYVLFLLTHSEPSEIDGIFRSLESYVMRRVVCKSDGRGYNRLFSDMLLTNKVLTADGFAEYIGRREDKLLAMPDDSELLEAVCGEYRINSQNTGILYMLETGITPSVSATQVRGISGYSLEHLMPKAWRYTWGTDGLSDETVSERDRLLWRLGNLAILPSRLNSSVSNARWEGKVSGNGSGKGLRECAGGLSTLRKYLDLPYWNEDTMKERAKDLYALMVRVWPDNIRKHQNK